MRWYKFHEPKVIFWGLGAEAKIQSVNLFDPPYIKIDLN